MEHLTFWLVSQCLNQLHYYVPPFDGKGQEKLRNSWFLHDTFSHLPHSAPVLSEEPNSNHPQPPHSPDLSLCDFWFFLSLRVGLDIIILCPWNKAVECNIRPQSCIKRGLPDALPIVAGPLLEVHVCRRAVLQT